MPEQPENVRPSVEPPETKNPWRLVPPVCLVVLVLAHFALVMRHWRPAIAHPDANGYWGQAGLLVHTGRTWFVPESDVQYVGMHWLLAPSGRYICRYPAGLPVLVALVYGLAGWKLSLLVNPILAALTLVALFLLTRRLLNGWWGLAAAAALAVNPLFNEHALTAISHMAVTCALTWGLYLLVRWSEERRLWQVFAAGLVLGWIPTVRYPEVLFGLGVAVFLLWHVLRERRLWRHALVALAGAALPVLALAARNQLVMGAFWRTGYALTNEQTGFGWSYFRAHATGYITALQGQGLGPLFTLGLLGMLAMCVRTATRRVGVLLLLLIVPSTLLYMAYYWAPGSGAAGLRFLVPTFICYAVAGTCLLWQVSRRWPRPARITVVVLMLALQLLWSEWGGLQRLERQEFQRRALAITTAALQKHAEPGDTVLANKRLLQHLDFVRRWKLVDMRDLMPRPRRGPFAPDQQDSDDPSPRQVEKERVRQQRFADLSPPERELAVAREIREWAGDGTVYLVAPAEVLDRMRGRCFNANQFEVVSRFTLPDPPENPNRRRRPGMPAGPAPDGAMAAHPDRDGPAAGPPDGGPPDGPPPDRMRPNDGTGRPFPPDRRRIMPPMRGDRFGDRRPIRPPHMQRTQQNPRRRRPDAGTTGEMVIAKWTWREQP